MFVRSIVCNNQHQLSCWKGRACYCWIHFNAHTQFLSASSPWYLCPLMKRIAPFWTDCSQHHHTNDWTSQERAWTGCGTIYKTGKEETAETEHLRIMVPTTRNHPKPRVFNQECRIGWIHFFPEPSFPGVKLKLGVGIPLRAMPFTHPPSKNKSKLFTLEYFKNFKHVIDILNCRGFYKRA